MHCHRIVTVSFNDPGTLPFARGPSGMDGGGSAPEDNDTVTVIPVTVIPEICFPSLRLCQGRAESRAVRPIARGVN